MEVLRGVATTLRFPEVGDDAVAFQAAPEVLITRDSDGKEVTKGEASFGGKEGEIDFYTFDLKKEDVAEVDLLNVEWSDKVASYNTRVEIVGGFVSSIASIKEKLGENPTSARVHIAREIATREIESACGVAFRPRYERDILDGKGTKRLLLRRRELNSVISVEVGGSALSPAEIAALELEPVGVLQSETPWPVGRSNVTVTYVHGHQYFTPATNPVRDYAAYLLSSHPSDWQGRATSFTNEFGSTYSLVTPGVRGARFPLPSVNSFVQEFSEPLVA